MRPTNFLIIDEDNFKYMVREETKEYLVSLTYAYPRKTKKGYLGMKHISTKHRLNNPKQALKIFENWKEEHVPLFHKKVYLALRICYMPITRYYVICPRCNKDAEILSWMLMMGTGMEESHNIICEHCSPSPDKIDALYNKVGECKVVLIGKEEGEQNISLQFHNSGIKWEDWINDNKKD